MRILTHCALTIASAALLCGPVAAQPPADGASSEASPQSGLKAGEIKISNLLGATVKRRTGDSIGRIEELIMSPDASVRAAVVSVGGVLGLGDKTVAIPFEQFSLAPDGATVFLTMSEQDLRALPAFDPNAEDDTRSAERVGAGAAAVEQPTAADRSTSAEQAAAAVLPSTPEPSVAAERAAAPARITTKASEEPASALIGAEVVDVESSPIGKIKDLIVTAEPPMVQAILALGGALGLGARSVAVPLDQLTITRDANDQSAEPDKVQTTLTVSQLETLPEYRY